MLRHALWALTAVAVGCTASSPSQPTEIDGATVYANNCSRCHEYRSPTEFNGPQWSIITTHMRVIGGIPGDEARAVFEFLKSQHHPPYIEPTTPITVPTATHPDQGRALVEQRGCIGCHVVEGQGGTMGPPLDGVLGRRDEAFIRQQLRDPRVNDAASLMPNLGLSRSEVDSIWAYLQMLDGEENR